MCIRDSAKTPEEKAKYNQMAEQIRSAYGNYTGGTSGADFYLNKPSPGSFDMEAAPTFSYDVEDDPVYAAYRKQYAREGSRATQDALGTAASATGGIPSSYAAAAASQAGDYYASQLSDKVPELYQQAYNRYLGELSQYNTDLSLIHILPFLPVLVSVTVSDAVPVSVIAPVLVPVTVLVTVWPFRSRVRFLLSMVTPLVKVMPAVICSVLPSLAL